jgi:ubiquinone biosynthesis protein COQ9
MLCPAGERSARRAIHLIFAGEKVKPDYSEPAPQIGGYQTARGLKLIPLADLVRMKLTSFRLKDQVHLKDLDAVDLITPEIESQLSALLKERLAQVRETA